jgi:hydroxypyruvate reductase
MTTLSTASTKPHILQVAKLSPYMTEKLHQAFTVHDRLHESDPAAFAAVKNKIEAIAANGESKVPAALIAQLPALRLISVFGVGYDGIDVPAAIAHGAKVTHTPDVLNDEVADLALALMLAVSRKIVQADQHVRSEAWLQGPMPLGRKVSGARLGIVGMGRIGQTIARRTQAFDMQVSYTARHAKPEVSYPYFSSVTELAAQVDFLVVITPGGAATRKLINADVLQALGPQGYLINVARGSVVDEAALIDALERGVIAGAGLDVFEAEPRVPEALRKSDKVVLTPHIGSATSQTRNAMADLAFDNLALHFAGKPLRTPVPECTARISQ